VREINLIVIHCSDSDVSTHDDISVIRKWHVQERGWKDVGYHYFITKSGDIQLGRYEDVAGAHAQGFNSHSIGICLSGKKQFSERQFFMAARLISGLMLRYGLTLLDIVPHNQLNTGKSCPNFDLSKIKKHIQIIDRSRG
jgi:N-acetyl-anhydromuramyl-L-alanine amidase AmpD